MISVLLIEDDEALLELTRDHPGKSGTVIVDTAQSAGAARAKIGKRSYDAVASDYLIPDMDGVMPLKTLRSFYNCVSSIMFTGKSREQVVIRGE